MNTALRSSLHKMSIIICSHAEHDAVLFVVDLCELVRAITHWSWTPNSDADSRMKVGGRKDKDTLRERVGWTDCNCRGSNEMMIREFQRGRGGGGGGRWTAWHRFVRSASCRMATRRGQSCAPGWRTPSRGRSSRLRRREKLQFCQFKLNR